jgi:predicted NAD/FAD-binding protein
VSRVAIVGAGVSGLAAAYQLRDSAELSIFEREARAGGHANTIAVEDPGAGEIGIDTGFIVCNGRTYPQLMEFFEELGVETTDHRGGFNFFDLGTGLQYGSEELDLAEEDVRARYPDEFARIWREARRFHKRGARDYVRGRTNVPLGEYLDSNGYSEEFKTSYVILLGSAVWSVPAELIWEMPAATVLGFFMSHDPGGLGGREVEWRTVLDGSRSYVRRVLEEIGARVELGCEVREVRPAGGGVEVVTDSGAEWFDACVVATHADEALALAPGAPAAAREMLARVRYSPAVATVHTDPSVLPPDRARWQSWNYGSVAVGGAQRTYVVWWMNHLQGFEASRDYFLTLDCPLPLDPAAVIREIRYMHPVVTVEVRNMQEDVYDACQGGPIKFCGSYFHSKRLGFDLIASHEAAFSSGVEAGSAVRRELEALRPASSVAD